MDKLLEALVLGSKANSTVMSSTAFGGSPSIKNLMRDLEQVRNLLLDSPPQVPRTALDLILCGRYAVAPELMFEPRPNKMGKARRWHERRGYERRINKKWLKVYGTNTMSKDTVLHDIQNEIVYAHRDVIQRIQDRFKNAIKREEMPALAMVAPALGLNLRRGLTSMGPVLW